MPAREMKFTYNTQLEITEKNAKQFAKEYANVIKDNKALIKKVYNPDCNEDLLFHLVHDIKLLKVASMVRNEQSKLETLLLAFVYDEVARENLEAKTILGIRYLDDVLDNNGCGSDDYEYLTYMSDNKHIEETIVEAQTAVDKLRQLGCKVEFTVHTPNK